MARSYVPDAGDIVWVSFNPQTGHEQAGHRPAVVLSPAAYNVKTSLMVCCPMTTQIKYYPFEVVIASASPSAVLADQVKSLDWRKRRAKHKGKISAAELAEVRAKIRTLIGQRSWQFISPNRQRAHRQWRAQCVPVTPRNSNAFTLARAPAVMILV
jgi:mRNA interferase MazF